MRIVLNEPKGDSYKKLIQLAFDTCDTFLFIKHSQLSYNKKSFDMLLKALEPDFIYFKEQNRWPGTFSVPTAKVYYFYTSENSKDIVKEITNSLFNWRAPNLPDDLCFLKGNEEWLINTAHERICNIVTKNDLEVEQLTKISELIYRIDNK
ncbi:stage III sporulation protein AH [Desulfosporosinus sp. FKB]|uniref:stage III sporulation protein AH n=1 Tax=Desulfosporosinus sp. FKB TaxID=1969835 RepID=UPI000B49F02C|nr:stage III sporulation protein AH [Desulfosporosinus sp. FKB]